MKNTAFSLKTGFLHIKNRVRQCRLHLFFKPWLKHSPFFDLLLEFMTHYQFKGLLRIRKAICKNFVYYGRYGYEMKALGPNITRPLCGENLRTEVDKTNFTEIADQFPVIISADFLKGYMWCNLPSPLAATSVATRTLMRPVLKSWRTRSRSRWSLSPWMAAQLAFPIRFRI